MVTSAPAPPAASCPTNSATEAFGGSTAAGIPPLQKIASTSGPVSIRRMSRSTCSSGICEVGSAGLSGICSGEV